MYLPMNRKGAGVPDGEPDSVVTVYKDGRRVMVAESWSGPHTRRDIKAMFSGPSAARWGVKAGHRFEVDVNGCRHAVMVHTGGRVEVEEDLSEMKKLIDDFRATIDELSRQ